ncbi:MAG: zinc ribbon domain-containing protein [Bacteroidales bacterium]|nr:zinc ribbon domain-containing protein [Bacteroidales bacterium]
MKCKQCGQQLPSGAKFCGNCGAPVSSTKEQDTDRGQQVTENIYLGKDGKYHWYYEFKLMKNPVVLYTILRVLAFCFFIVFLLLSIITLFASPSYRWLDDILGYAKVFVCLTPIMMILGAFSYVIWAGINGWSYCVMFEMDEKGVTHTQMPKQFKKAQAMSAVLMFAGIATGNVGRVGQGMLVKGHSSISSAWHLVRDVQIIRRHNTIKVNERMFKNQVYAYDADFDFVADYIVKHVGKNCKITE